MKKLLITFSLAGLLLMHSSCEDIEQILPKGLTNEEVVDGLKSMLEVSTDTSVSKLSLLDGYYGDEAVKILLPPEASVIFDNITKIPGGRQLVESTILSINRAAEDAATEATPIFVNAITGMTISDGFTILNGVDTAATGYLYDKTYLDLRSTFQPKIDVSLSKPLVGSISASSAYADLVGKYNLVANNSFGLIKPITQNTLSAYVTEKALSGLFVKVADEEQKIRGNASHRVSELLNKIFKK